MVIYFSGNGNSKAIAVSLAKHLQTTVLSLEGKRLLTPNTDSLQCNDEHIVWVFPVYSWGVPPVVANYINNTNINLSPECLHHLVITCGDDAGLTANQWRNLVNKRGWKTGSATSVIMPNTYVCMKGFDVDPKELAEQKIRYALNSIERITARINSNNLNDEITKGNFATIKSKIIYPWFKRYAMSPKQFHSTDACISCGKCAHNCPMLNITMSATGRPEWSNTCALCLRCYHQCPVHAIAYGNHTAVKGQYRYPGKDSRDKASAD